ncbi:MAG TPA: hypothetical protein PLW19_04240 [Anaerolineaceae bacterium]|jgi:hypothetical protein|nr:hypothetical protein [Anaerolineaceae bacterium]
MTIYKYKGGGIVYGLPARDIKEKEWDKLPQRLQEAGLKTGIYEKVVPEKIEKDGGQK